MHNPFQLNTSAARVAALLTLIDQVEAGKSGAAVRAMKACAEAEATGRGYYRRAVVAENRRHASITEAARTVAHLRPDLWQNTPAALRMDAYAVMKGLQALIRRWCDADDVEGYYWAE